MQVDKLDRSKKAVDSQGRPTQELNLFSEVVSRLPPIIGQGSPEGEVEAIQSQTYMDEDGMSGSILYIKKYSDIAGDKKLGWVLV